MHIKVTCLRQILRDVRRLPADRQAGVVDLFRAAVGVAKRDEFPGPGEGVRLYRAKVDMAQREQTRRRILAALQAGEKPADIAKRERVSQQWVRRLRAKNETARP